MVDVNNMLLANVSVAAAAACAVSVKKPLGRSAESVSSGGITSGGSFSADCLRIWDGRDLSRRKGAAVGVGVEVRAGMVGAGNAALSSGGATAADAGDSKAADVGVSTAVDIGKPTAVDAGTVEKSNDVVEEDKVVAVTTLLAEDASAVKVEVSVVPVDEDRAVDATTEKERDVPPVIDVAIEEFDD